MVSSWTDEIISAHVKDVSFADVGGLWGLVNEKITVAVQAGCRAATMIDIMPTNHRSWTEFDQRARSMGVTGYKKLQGNVDDLTLPDKAAPSTSYIAQALSITFQIHCTRWHACWP